MIVRLIIYYIFNLTDIALTLYGVSIGACAEVNPVINGLLSNPVLFSAVKIIVPAILCIYLYKCRKSKLARVASWICCISYGALTVWNAAMLFIL